MNPDRAIMRIYAQVPDVQCKGLCHASCGPVMMSDAERARIEARHGTAPGLDPTLAAATLRCSKLDAANRCSIYADRPLICRLFGATRKLRCPYGCGPSGGFLPDRKAGKLLHALEALPPTKQSEDHR